MTGGEPDNAAPHLRRMTADDWPAVRRIYGEGIETRNATFETDVPSWEGWDDAHLERPRIVAEVDDEVVGWAALSPVSSRCVYAGVAEVSIYVGEEARGRGLGRALLTELVRASEDEGIWTLQAGIFPENEVSIGLHESLGFRVVGVRERLGRLEGEWRDVVLMERRSDEVGL